MDTKKIIDFWYKKLNFKREYDKEFYDALEHLEIDKTATIDTYNFEETNGKKNLLYFLYFCENLKEKYEEKRIPANVLLDTLKDIVSWTNVWTELKGELYLGEIKWLKFHMTMRIFRLGRLQFCIEKATQDIPTYGILKDDDVIGIHIPSGGSMTKEMCIGSINSAKEFFKEFYPEFGYKGFTCNSWLLDNTLRDILPKDSNIVAFQNMFDVVYDLKCDAVLKYVFNWDTTRENIAQGKCTTGFSEKVKEAVLSGKEFYQSIGVLKM